MKKTLKIVVAVLLAAALLAGLTACGTKTLNGTYKSEETIGGKLGGTLTFDKDNHVTGTIMGLAIDGTYTIEKDKITFTFSNALLGIGATQTKTFEKKGDSIWLDGTEYVKQ